MVLVPGIYLYLAWLFGGLLLVSIVFVIFFSFLFCYI